MKQSQWYRSSLFAGIALVVMFITVAWLEPMSAIALAVISIAAHAAYFGWWALKSTWRSKIESSFQEVVRYHTAQAMAANKMQSAKMLFVKGVQWATARAGHTRRYTSAHA